MDSRAKSLALESWYLGGGEKTFSLHGNMSFCVQLLHFLFYFCETWLILDFYRYHLWCCAGLVFIHHLYSQTEALWFISEMQYVITDHLIRKEAALDRQYFGALSYSNDQMLTVVFWDFLFGINNKAALHVSSSRRIISSSCSADESETVRCN